MSNRRTLRIWRLSIPSVLLILAVLLVACGGDDGDDAADDDGDSPTAADSPTQATSQKATPTAASKVPTLSSGGWTGGEADARTTGGASISLKGTLTNQSSTDKGTTRLIFADDVKTILISISSQYQPFSVSVYDGKTSVRSGPSDEPCKVNYKESSDKRLEGTFTCEDARVEIGGQGAVVIEGTFLATR